MGLPNQRCGIFTISLSAVILVLGMKQLTFGQDEIYHLKWSQPPIETDTQSETPLYCGWDEPSLHSMTLASEAGSWKIVADDFRCLGAMPIASVHWWGSYNGWTEMTPPTNKPIAWRIAFWSNVPADSKKRFSRPGRLLWQVEVSADRVYQESAGIDTFPQKSSDTCFQYYVQLKSDEYFWQSQFTDVTVTDSNQSIFWISITAIYPSSLANAWGWKTRPRHWMDDAVKFELTVSDMQPGLVADSTTVKNITSSAICSIPEGYDTAFELGTDPNYIKWEQPFTGIRNWQHYEDEESMALEDQAGVVQIRRLVADDWKCQGSTPITSIVWWGSYIGYRYQVCQCESTSGEPKQTKPDYFLLSIWTDVPDPNLNNPQDFSHPGQKVWEYKASEYDEVLVGYDKQPEIMLAALPEPIPLTSSEPNVPLLAYEPVFRYSVRLPQENWFCQENEIQVYWLSVVAVYNDPQSVNFPWGWTNHEGASWDSSTMNSDAVAGQTISSTVASPTWVWQELYDQVGKSEDMSFVLAASADCNGSPLITCRPACTTTCPAVQTTCPAVVTRCPPVQTQCPTFAVSTQCPPVQTRCPTQDTACPPSSTKCPPSQTQCPTFAVSTQCPPVQTRCPPTDTSCPPETTKCPPDSTRCPPVQTQCPVVSTQCPAAQTRCPVVDTQCPTSSTKCPVAQTQCPSVSTQCPVVSTRCPSVNTQCPTSDTECPPYDTECPSYYTKCPPADTQCPHEETRCPPRQTYCPPDKTWCPGLETYCPTKTTYCPPVNTQCPAPVTVCVIIETCRPINTVCPRCGPFFDSSTGAWRYLAAMSCPAIEAECPSIVSESARSARLSTGVDGAN